MAFLGAIFVDANSRLTPDSPLTALGTEPPCASKVTASHAGTRQEIVWLLVKL